MDGQKSKIFDRFLNFVLRKRNLYLILIILIALVLRITIASNVYPLADEMNVAVRSINIHNSGTMNSIDESHSFYFLTEIGYKLTGYINLITARAPSILFGILSILLIYLIVLKLYRDEKIALVSAFLVAISGFQIRYSLAEMDITMAFFVLLSSYAFLSAIYDKKDYMYYISALFLGLAIATKTFAGVWVLSYLAFGIFYISKNKEYGKEYIGKKGLKIILICFFIVLISLVPVIIANYLLYKDRGIVDFQIARYLNINKEYYAGISGIESPFLLSQIFTGMKSGINTFWILDPAISVLAILGFILTFKKYREANIFLFLWFLFTFLFISGTAWLETHFVYNTLIFSIFSALFIVNFDKMLLKKGVKFFIPVALILILMINLWILAPHLTSKTAISKMRSYTIENIEKDSLVIVDQRIFRGRTAFIFNDRYYLEAAYLPQIINQFGSSSVEKVRVKTYFIECLKDDCGWGNIKDQPELNKSMEDLIKTFQGISSEKATIYAGGGGDEKKGEPYFKIYETAIELNPAALKATEQTHVHFFYPVNWKGEIYDKYNVKNSVDGIANEIGFFIFYLTILLEILSPFILIWFFKREKINPN
ncbi:MAG: glycosyltransferase family 39 protein [Candidatus Pacearchaeota archaeon]